MLSSAHNNTEVYEISFTTTVAECQYFTQHMCVYERAYHISLSYDKWNKTKV